MPLAPGVAGTARGLLRRPGFALGAILTLAVAIGVNAAVFSVVDAVLLRPLPFPEPDRLSFLTREGDVSVPDGVDWRAETQTFEDIALFLRRWNLDLTGDGDPERVFASVAEPSYFRVLAMAPLLGRADLSTYALAAAALATATACACLVPALRAARLDPAAILREP